MTLTSDEEIALDVLAALTLWFSEEEAGALEVLEGNDPADTVGVLFGLLISSCENVALALDAEVPDPIDYVRQLALSVQSDIGNG